MLMKSKVALLLLFIGMLIASDRTDRANIILIISGNINGYFAGSGHLVREAWSIRPGN